MKIPYPLNFRSRLVLGGGLLSLFVVGVAVTGVGRLEAQQEWHQAKVATATARQQLAAGVLEEAHKRALATHSLLVIRDNGVATLERETVQKAHDRLHTKLDTLRQDLSTTGDDPVADALTADLGRIEAEYAVVSQRIVAQFANRQKSSAEDQLDRLGRPLMMQFTLSAERLSAHLARQVGVAAAEGAVQLANARQLLLWAGGLAVLIALGVSWAFARSITRALGAEPQELVAVAHRLADGHLVDEASADAHGLQRSETATPSAAPQGSVLAAMLNMQTQLRRIVHEVRAGSDSIASASSQIVQGNLSLQQTSATMAQHWATVCRNADTARQASEVAATASVNAECGGEVVVEVAKAMEALDASTHKIASIINVIDSIAFQTNILAMNAAVEAARAGEQGRGFAVVANEVRNLAQRSATAAREIKSIVEDCVDRAEEGSGLAQKASKTMVEVVASIRQVADMMSEISDAAQHEAQGAAPQALGYQGTQGHPVHHAHAAMVQEGAAAADSLREQAKRLVSLVAAFRVEQAGIQHDYAAAAAAQAIDRASHLPAAPPLALHPSAPSGAPSGLVRPTAEVHDPVAHLRRSTMAAASAAVREDDWSQF